MPELRSMDSCDLRGKRVLIREDFNVPLQAGVIQSDLRIQAAVPTLQHALKAGAAVIVVSHLGRPEEGKVDPEFSLAPVAKRLSELLKHPVRFLTDWIDGISVQSGEVVLCENVRFLVGEMDNDSTLSKKMAALCDLFVMDAFATAHRAQVSTAGVAQFAKEAVAGPLLMAELNALHRVMDHPAHPVLAIVGGAKVSSKLQVLSHLLKKVDQLIVGGGMANTLLAAKGVSVGQSLCESHLFSEAQAFLKKAEQCGVDLLLPCDVVVAAELSSNAKTTVKSVDEVSAADRILDVGPETSALYRKKILAAKTVLWNGPVGAFEWAPFSEGTRQLAKAIAESAAFSVAGGGDTLNAIEQFGITEEIDYISTGGGAFLEALEGKTLPGVAVLQKASIKG